MAIKLEKEQVISLYETGMTKKEVAQELHVTATTLSKFMKENDIPTRNPKTYKKSAKVNYKSIREEKMTISYNDNIGYQPKKIERVPAQKKENALNLYIPEKWSWRD